MRSTLTAVRESLEKSQRQVEKESGVSRGVLSKYENGWLVPKPEQAERIAPFYGLTADEFREYAKQENDRRKKTRKAS